MKQRIVFCLLLAFSAAAHGFACRSTPYTREQFLSALIEAFDSDPCPEPYVFPRAHVTTPTKDTARVDPKSYLVDENIFTFELAPTGANSGARAK